MIPDSVIASLGVLFLYLQTRYPSISGGDSGELLAEACQLGTAHPPGYPLFTLLAHCAIQLGSHVELFLKSFKDGEFFIGKNYEWLSSSTSLMVSPAVSVNSFCCVLGAATCFILANTVTLYLSFNQEDTSDQVDEKKVSHQKSTFATHGAVAGVVFALSPLTWEYSIGAEVFALNNFLIASIIYLFVSFNSILVSNRLNTTSESETKDELFFKLLAKSKIGALVSGLAMSNQHTSILCIVPITLHVLKCLYNNCPFSRNKPIVFSRALGYLALYFLLGLSPYLYLVMSTHYPKAGSWGDLTTVAGFLRHVFRSEYGTLSLGVSKLDNVEGALVRWAVYAFNLSKQVSILGIGFALLGCQHVLFGCEDERGGLVLITTLCFYLLIWNGVFSNLPLSNPMGYEVQSRFWMQPNLIVCFFIGLGSHKFTSRHFGNDHRVEMFMSRALLIGFLLITSSNSYSSDHFDAMKAPSGGWIMHDYAKSIMNSLPADSMLLSFSDLNWNTVRYLQTCEGTRNDISHISIQLLPFPWFQRQISNGLYPNIKFPSILPDASTNRADEGYKKLISRFLNANIQNHDALPGGLYIEMQAIDSDDWGTYLKDEFVLLPWGLVFRVLPKNDAKDLPNDWHPKSLHVTKQVRDVMTRHTKTNVRNGSWEHAAMTIYWDMHYELGVHMLGLAIDMMSALKTNPSLLVPYMQMLKVSSKLLMQVQRTLKLRGTFR
jgi:hypothetical protein